MMREPVESKDRYGTDCIIFKTHNLKDIQEWLWDNYGGYGYKFSIVIDMSKDEYEVPGETYVYFLDEILPEAAEYAGKEIVNKAFESEWWNG